VSPFLLGVPVLLGLPDRFFSVSIYYFFERQKNSNEIKNIVKKDIYLGE